MLFRTSITFSHLPGFTLISYLACPVSLGDILKPFGTFFRRKGPRTDKLVLGGFYEAQEAYMELTSQGPVQHVILRPMTGSQKDFWKSVPNKKPAGKFTHPARQPRTPI